MAISKVIYGGKVLIDLTADDVTADKLLKGTTAHGANGEPLTGTCPFDMDTSEATVTAAEILSGKTAGSKGVMLTGSMKNNGAVSGVINTKDGQYTVPQGYHDGSGTVQIDATEQSKITPDNIRDGVTILGVLGTMSGTEGAKAQFKVVTPSTSEQVIVPDSAQGYNYLTQVTVSAIPYTESDNSAGGKTVTIA